MLKANGLLFQAERFLKRLKHMKWWPVKSDKENPPYVSMHNFGKMHWMEKFTAYNPEQTFWKYLFSKAEKTRVEKPSFKLTVTEIMKIKLQYLKIQMPIKREHRICSKIQNGGAVW